MKTRPRRVSRAAKKRKRSKVVVNTNVDYDKTPKCLVIGRGITQSMPCNDLVKDLQAVMLPYSSTKLRSKKSINIKDVIAVGKSLSVTHLQVVVQRTRKKHSKAPSSKDCPSPLDLNLPYMKLTWSVSCLPHGPTLTFDIVEYSLRKDVRKFQKQPRSMMSDYQTPALVVLKGFKDPTESAYEIAKSAISGMYPTVDVSTINVGDCRRVVLYSYTSPERANADDFSAMAESPGLVDFRHYAILRTLTQVSRPVQKLISKGNLLDMSKLGDVADFVLESSNAGAASDSEVDNVPQIEIESGKGKSPTTVGIKLVELGPRMLLKLLRIQEGIHTGNLVFPTKQDQAE